MVFVSGSSDKTLKLWNIDNGQLIRTFEGHSDTIKTVKISNNNLYILSGSNDNTCKLWKL
jgi:WD40 repeat protein